MTTRVSCSWCHRLNVIGPPPVYCDECGHRADVARLDCDCGSCSDQRVFAARVEAVRRAADCRCGGLCDSGVPCPMRHQ